jgi:hypothetical protein
MSNVYYPLGAPCDDMSEGEFQRQYYGPEDEDGWGLCLQSARRRRLRDQRDEFVISDKNAN